MAIGSFYNARGVLVGQAMGLYAPENTPLPADTINLFDEATWASTAVSVGAATAGAITLSLSGGPIDPGNPLTTNGVITTAPIAYNAPAATVAAAITTALNAAGVYSLTPVVTGTGSSVTPWVIALVGAAGAEVVVSAAVGTPLTGGALLLVPPAWTPCGGTEQGWQNTYNPSVQEITIEEQSTPTGRNVTTATYEFTANLSEDSMDNLKLALSAARTITAPDATHYGVDELSLTSNLPVLAVALETKNRRGYPRRYYIPGATVATNVGQTFARASKQRLVPVTFSSVCDTSLIKVRSITANHA